MESLLQVFSDSEIGELLEVNPLIRDILDEEVDSLIKILKDLNIKDDRLRNVILSCPNYLSRPENDVLDLINKLRELGISSLEVLIDTYPMILDKYDYEIDDFYEKMQNKGKTRKEINEILLNGAFILDE